MTPYARHSVDPADIEAVTAVLKSDRLTQGPEVERFEQDFAAACEAPHAVSFSSGTAALHAAAFTLGIGKGDEVITSAITFLASANCAAYLGATPRFCDIDSSLNMTPRTVKEAMGYRTKAVVVVHLAGLPADTQEIARVSGVPIIEDAAHALGATTKDGPVGNCAHSAMCCFSLHPSKAITAGEGGMVTTRVPEYAAALRRFRNHGQAIGNGHKRDQLELGYNYRLSDIHAALGRSQLTTLKTRIALRRRIAGYYRRALHGYAEMPPAHKGHAYHLFIIRHPERQKLYEGLLERGIQTEVHYRPVYRNTFHAGEPLPNAEAYYERCLSLPIYPTLTDDEQHEVIQGIRDVLG